MDGELEHDASFRTASSRLFSEYCLLNVKTTLVTGQTRKWFLVCFEAAEILVDVEGEIMNPVLGTIKDNQKGFDNQFSPLLENWVVRTVHKFVDSLQRKSKILMLSLITHDSSAGEGTSQVGATKAGNRGTED